MILLKMEKENGFSKPLELIINGESHVYDYSSGESKDYFFRLLDKYINYKVRVEYYNQNKDFLYKKNYILREVFVRDGIMTLDLFD